jgi:hypothetical protein
MLYRLSFLSVVSVLALAGVMFVTTPAAAQAVAPGACEWPVPNNRMTEGLFDGSYTINGEISASYVVTVTGHPCGYGNGYNPYNAGSVRQLVPDQSPLYSNRISFWARGDGSATGVYINTVNGVDCPILTTYPCETINITDNQWTFYSVCVEGHNPAIYSAFQSEPIGYSVVIKTMFGAAGSRPVTITGLSVVPNTGLDCAGNVIPPLFPTAVPTAVPTQTPQPQPILPPPMYATAVPIVRPTRVPIVELAPAPVYTLPVSVRDLPALPGPLNTDPPQYNLPLPDLNRDHASFVLSVAATINESVAGSHFWGIVRFMGYTMMSVGLLGILIYK